MATALAFLLLALVTNGAAFFGLRYAAARVSGVRGARVIFGMDHDPWGSVRFARKVVFAVAGPVGCYLSAVLFVTAGLVASGKDVPNEHSMRVTVRPGGPAAEAGIMNGDQVVSVDGVAVSDWTHLREAVAKHAGERIAVAVLRGERKLVLSPAPGPNGTIGVAGAAEHRDIGLAAALGQGFAEPLRVWAETAKGFVQMLVGRVTPTMVIDTNKAPLAAQYLRQIGTMNAYYLWIPTILALAFFPRGARSKARGPR